MSYAHNQPEYRVSELAGHVKRLVEEEFAHVRVRGEISKCHVNGASGHAYITMKDDKAVIEAVCWRGTMSQLRHKPEVGMEVIATGRLTTYPQRSQYQLVIEVLEPAGEGALMAMLEARKKQLAAEGLFDAARKKPIPFLPETIGMITSPTGAVIRDMLHRISDRFPSHVLLWPVQVQGEGAAEQVVTAIEGFHKLSADGKIKRPDVLIVARGGGSIEDLWAFNEEIVARAVAAAEIPVISAIGHETDTTLIDYAADWRAPTPTAAAEKAVPVLRDLTFTVEEYGLSLKRAMLRKLDYAGEKLQQYLQGLLRFPRSLQEKSQRIDDVSSRLAHAPMRGILAKENRLAAVAAAIQPRLLLHVIAASQSRLDNQVAVLNQLARERLARLQHRVEMAASKLSLLDITQVLKRGFALVKDSQGALVKNAAVAAAKTQLTVTFYDGEVPVQTGKNAGTIGVSSPQMQAKPKPKKVAAKKATVQESLF